nr:SAM-dependent methyltransferase [Cellulomonas sp. A375-1]
MASQVPSDASIVADFCAGEGALLEAAESWLPGVRIAGTDLDGRNVRVLRDRHRTWRVGKLDLLSMHSRRSSTIFRAEFYDAVLLNPPFSYRGGAGRMVPDGEGGSRRVSPSVAFLDAAIPSIKPDGVVIALLPLNALESDRDRWWHQRVDAPAIEVIDVLEPRKFPGVVARMAVVRVSRRVVATPVATAGTARELTEKSTAVARSVDVEIVRGRVPVHVARTWVSGESRFIHTPDLRRGVVLPQAVVGPAHLSSRGPLVLLPRVGRVTPEKVACWDGGESLILSDCVFGLRPLRSGLELASLREAIVSDSVSLAAAYQGSCAPYLTIARLNAILEEVGLVGSHVPASP